MSALLVLTAFLAISILLAYHRLHYHRFVQYAHIPQPPTSLIWGHMALLHKFMSMSSSQEGGPSDRHIDLVLLEIWHSLGQPPLFLMDLRPVGPCLCIIASHHLAEQISRSSAAFAYSVPKSYTLGELVPLVGHDSMIIKEGQEWKELRKRFNPGFAPGHLMGLLPVVAEKVWMFTRLLERVVSDSADQEGQGGGKVVRLDMLTQGLTVDVIGEVVMEVDVGAQEELLGRADLGEDAAAAAAGGGEEEEDEGLMDTCKKGGKGEGHGGGEMSNFTKTYYRLITSYAADMEGKPPIKWWLQLLTNNPFSRHRRRRHRHRQLLSQKVDTFLREFVQRKYRDEFQSTTTTTTTKKTKSILSLSLSLSEKQEKSPLGLPCLPPKILSTTTDALKTFLFAGHDTTAILIGWVLYYLSICPRAHSRVSSELDSIFGPSATPAEIRAQLSAPGEGGPDKLNKMVYTHAVIKEALRLHPPAGTARRAEVGSGFVVSVGEPSSSSSSSAGQEKGGQSQQGRGGAGRRGGEWNVDGMVLYNCATIIHRDPEVYGETKDEFWPERWLSEEDKDKGEIPAGAWRPFERGPRDCIGRDLAIIEAKVVVALVHGRYEFVKVGLGEKVLVPQQGPDGGEEEKLKPVVDGTGCCVVKEKLYTRRQVTARAADGMRMKVRLAKGVVGGLEG
ncbi:cytochrome P450 [Pseudoneurospora amorphoporcata]|uniref:Cytochrome P450 n=1 Tax=Pseudoneurospora amorphoporcata TaxID=241081 RepID=A0AAN6SIM7_9PEZI|nr:cytochrome P450 [Pseudoneurospora amorphoporcata]